MRKRKGNVVLGLLRFSDKKGNAYEKKMLWKMQAIPISFLAFILYEQSVQNLTRLSIGNDRKQLDVLRTNTAR